MRPPLHGQSRNAEFCRVNEPAIVITLYESLRSVRSIVSLWSIVPPTSAVKLADLPMLCFYAELHMFERRS